MAKLIDGRAIAEKVYVDLRRETAELKAQGVTPGLAVILVPRETPWNLIHARNVVTLLEAGAIVLPAVPSFYSRPSSLTAVVDTVVWRILDQIGLPNAGAYRWGEQKGSAKTSRRKS